MGSTKSRQKKGGFLVRREEVDNFVAFHRRQVQACVKDPYHSIPSDEISKWVLRGGTNTEEKLRGVPALQPVPPTRDEIKEKITTLKLANEILHALEPVLVFAQNKTPESAYSILEEAADYLSKIAISDGRPMIDSMYGPGALALELSQFFLRRTGRCQWQLVGEAVAREFPDAVPLKDDPDHPTDLRLWAYRLVQRRLAHHDKLEMAVTWGWIKERLSRR